MNTDIPTDDPRLRQAVTAHPYPLLFATISGAHLYGFPSADSDFDLRGVHLLSFDKLLVLEVTDETLNEGEFHLRHIDNLVARKRAGAEQGTLADDDVAFHEGEFARLLAELEAAAERSPLPELPAGRAELNALLLSLRGQFASTATKLA